MHVFQESPAVGNLGMMTKFKEVHEMMIDNVMRIPVLVLVLVLVLKVIVQLSAIPQVLLVLVINSEGPQMISLRVLMQRWSLPLSFPKREIMHSQLFAFR